MLQRLLIQNYAIISALEIDFSSKLSIITGETGAGKSILMGALGLALGNRADLSQLGDRAKKLIVEATFISEGKSNLKELLLESDIDIDAELILRREIAANGKSRCFVNDTPVSLGILQSIASLLVDLHQQFDTLQLGNKDFQRTLLDASAGSMHLMNEYAKLYSEYVEVSKKIVLLKQHIAKADQEREYTLFLLTELDELNWLEGEGKQLEEELNVLSHAEQIRDGLSTISYTLADGEQPMLAKLKNMQTVLQSLASFHADLHAMSSRMGAAYLELKDLSGELQSMMNKILVDEKRMDQINERLSNSQRLVKKHGLVSADELVVLRNGFHKEVKSLEHVQDELDACEKEKDLLFNHAYKVANQIHEKRVKQVPVLEKSTKELLARVGMPNASLKIEVKKGELSPVGLDQISFLFDANKSGNYEPLHKVASGGELSRLMLILKSLVADSLEMPTLIFDEIDTGISGEAARQVGLLMEELADSHQLISITHQPQIAAKADYHLYVFKQEVNGMITTGIKRLLPDESIMAVARMLAGENPSEAAIASAKEMMVRN
jgi:DNA repair protein RecN (Recombination protein N)